MRICGTIFMALLMVVIAIIAACSFSPTAPQVPEEAMTLPEGSRSSPQSSPLSDIPPKPSLATIRFTIQVGAFSTSWRAARLAERLAGHGLDAFYFIDADGLCKVRFGRYDSREEALGHADVLKARGVIEGFWVARINSDALDDGGRGALGERLVETAKRFMGTAYRWGGDSEGQGFDCSGLTMTVYRLNGLHLPRNSRDQFVAGVPVSAGALQKGDLVFFATGGGDRISHVGIYTGKGRFIHAPGRGKRIRSASLTDSYFEERFRGARRYF